MSPSRTDARATRSWIAGRAEVVGTLASAEATSTRSAAALVSVSGDGSNTGTATSVLTPLAGPISSATSSFDGSAANGRIVSATTIAHDRVFAIAPPVSTSTKILVDIDSAGASGTLADLDIVLGSPFEPKDVDDPITQLATIELVLALPSR